MTYDAYAHDAINKLSRRFSELEEIVKEIHPTHAYFNPRSKFEAGVKSDDIFGNTVFSGSLLDKNDKYFGVYVEIGAKERFWECTCPCNITVNYPINGLPEVDTLHPCGNPNHWTIKFKDRS